jgi:hypothetical protein
MQSATSSRPSIVILLIAADPFEQSRLRLDEEARCIQQAIDRSEYREHFELRHALAATPTDVRRALLAHEPNIVQFSGHGSESGELWLQDELGQAQPIQPYALAGLLNLFHNSVSCVILNACYSEAQARAITQHINYVIGMRLAISDGAAIEFSRGFYDGIGAGRDVEFAFRLGQNAISLANIPDDLIPELYKRPDDEGGSSGNRLPSSNPDGGGNVASRPPVIIPENNFPNLIHLNLDTSGSCLEKFDLLLTLNFSETWLDIYDGRARVGLKRGELIFQIDNGRMPYGWRNFVGNYSSHPDMCSGYLATTAGTDEEPKWEIQINSQQPEVSTLQGLIREKRLGTICIEERKNFHCGAVFRINCIQRDVKIVDTDNLFDDRSRNLNGKQRCSLERKVFQEIESQLYPYVSKVDVAFVV